jgi:hypothetical protein
MVGDGHAVRVAGQIMEHVLRPAEGALGINHPVLPEERPQERPKGFLLGQWLEVAGKNEFPSLKGTLQAGDKFAAENTAQHLHRQEESVARMNPVLVIGRQTARRDHTVRLRATPEQLGDALGACTELNSVYRRLVKMALEELRLIDKQMIGRLDKEMAGLLSKHQDAVQRLAEVPGLGVDSAQQIIAEVGPTAAAFPSQKCLSSWVGACPGDDESARVNHSHRSPKGNRHMRRLLNQAANAAARTKGSIFEVVYHRSVPRRGHNQAIGAIAHRQCRLIWLTLHQGVRYEERGTEVSKRSKQLRTWKMIRQLRKLGYRIEPPNPQPSQPPAQ